ncbi:MAG: C25 family cysteine peptidase [Methanotrichaceae archaeon]
MRLLVVLLALAFLFSTANAQLDRGVKGDVEDIILVGADDWHSLVAATPMAIWSENNRTVAKTLLILPKDVQSGNRMGWIEQSDLDTYGIAPILHDFKSANISSVIIHGSSESVKSLVDAAHKEGLKAYVTVSLELPEKSDSRLKELGTANLDTTEIVSVAEKVFLGKIGLDAPTLDKSKIDPSWLQVANPGTAGSPNYFCPVNPDAREYLYNQIETLIDDYKVDGVVLYNIGFQNENYCFCDFCKEQFYKDTGIDLTKVSANSYNTERWRQWKQDQITEIVNEARNITTDLGPVKLGFALGNPFDRSLGYNYADISKASDFTLISPVSASDVKLASSMTDKPIYIRLSDSYVQYVLSAQNVEGTIKYIEDLNHAGASGFAFEHNVVYTPLWSELEPPSSSARWLLQQLGGKTLGIGNISWRSGSTIRANNSADLAEKLSLRWKNSSGAVIVGENYTAGLSAASLASYLNWPVLFTGSLLPAETSSALKRLKANKAVIFGPISEQSRKNLSDLNLTLMEGNDGLLLKEMEIRGDKPDMIVLTNSRDLTLLPPVPKEDIKRDLIGDLLVHIEMSPSQIPSEELGETVRLNITLTNSNSTNMDNIRFLDIFPSGKMLRPPKPSRGIANVTDPYTGNDVNPDSAFENGSLLKWRIDRLGPSQSATMTIEVEILYPMDSGWKQRLDSGATASYDGLELNRTMVRKDDWPITNITYPARMFSGVAQISWNIDRASSYTAINIYSPDSRSGLLKVRNTSQESRYTAKIPLLTTGKWIFNIEAGDGYTHRTQNYTIDVRSNVEPLNITAFSHTKVPRLSLVAAQVAAAHKALLVDIATPPQEIDPLNIEESLNERIDNLKLMPEYLTVVGDPGSLPFISTGLKQDYLAPMIFDIYRDYQIQQEENGNYTKTAVGRIMGLSVYDASQLVARTFAYDKLSGAWKNNALVISSPPLVFPQTPVAISIRDYLKDAGLNVRDLRQEEATYQQAVSQMNNGQNIVHFDNHGNQEAWGLSDWSMTDTVLDEPNVKLLTLSPQTTTSTGCLTSNLKGFSINVSGTEMYIPRKLEDSLALAFIRAGSVNYVGNTVLSWIFLDGDYSKRFYQSLIFENSTVGQAELEADSLFRMKVNGADNIKKNLSDYDESLPDWDISVKEILNQTAIMTSILGDPSFRPKIPKTPPLPYATEVKTVEAGTGTNANASSSDTSRNKTSLEVTLALLNETSTDWIYWVETDTTGGKLKLNSQPALIGEVMLPKDADKIVVRENGLTVWHDEYTIKDQKRVMWPIVMPRLGENRTFGVEYVLIPGQVQVINVTAGWNAVSTYLVPKDKSISKYLKNKPYRGIFSVSGEGWTFAMKGYEMKNATRFEPGVGYLIDSSGNFTIELNGKPVDLPYRLNLNKGWNMVGLPVNETIDIRNITVNAEHRRYKYPAAVEKGIVSAFVWEYDGSDWSHRGENEALQPGKAYLIEAMSDCKLEFGK